jgi:hypothetical protein
LLKPSARLVSWIITHEPINKILENGSVPSEACCNRDAYSNIWAYFCNIESGSLKKTGTVISEMSFPILPLMICQSPGLTLGSFYAGSSDLATALLLFSGLRLLSNIFTD